MTAMTVARGATLALAALGCIYGVSLAQERGEMERAQLADGRRIAERNCAQCHAVGPTGDSPAVGAPKMRELGERFPFTDFALSLRDGMLLEHPAMPQLRLTVGEIESLIVYLRSLQTRQAVEREVVAPHG